MSSDSELCRKNRQSDDKWTEKALAKGISPPKVGEIYYWSLKPGSTEVRKITISEVWQTDERCLKLVRYAVQNGEGSKETTVEFFVFLRLRIEDLIIGPE